MEMESVPSIQINDSIISFRTEAANLCFRHVSQYIPALWVRQRYPYTGERELGIRLMRRDKI